MSLAFLVDDQLPTQLAEYFRSLGFEATHVRDIGLGGRPDDEIADAADQRGSVLVTKDQDFVIRSHLGKLAAPILWIRVGNASNRALLRSIGPLLPRCFSALEAGERIVEIR